MTSQNTRYVALILEEGSKLANVLTIDAEQNNRKSLEKLDFLPKNDEYFIPKQISCVDPRTEYLHWKKHKRDTIFYQTSRRSLEWTRIVRDQQMLDEFDKSPSLNCFVAYATIVNHFLKISFDFTNSQKISSASSIGEPIPGIMNFGASNLKTHYPFLLLTGSNISVVPFERTYYTIVYSLLDLTVKGFIRLSPTNSQSSEILSLATTLLEKYDTATIRKTYLPPEDNLNPVPSLKRRELQGICKI